MNMLSFYGGPAGKDFTITKIFPNKTAMDADIALGNNSPIYAGDYVLISYGDPNQPEFAENLTVDGDISYNATLWKKEWNNGYSYKEIMSIASNYPKFTAGNIDTSLKFGEAPQLTIDSSSLANPKVGLKMPASLRAGTANTTESVAPTATASIAPVYGGTLGNELSFQAKVPQGVTFIPSVSNAGEISWTNNGNLPNPATKNVKGPKGDNGDPGIVISATQPTAESHPVWINPEGEASPAGGTDLSLGVTGATVGQIAKITAVDDSGKPTAWEAVDMAGGESSFPKFEKLLTHTITEEEIAANPIAFVWGTGQIPNLNDFNVFTLTIRNPDDTTKITFTKWVRLKINNVLMGNICGTSQGEGYKYSISANRLYGFWVSDNMYNPNNDDTNVLTPPYSRHGFDSNLAASEAVTSIGFTSYNTDYGLTAGIVVEIWGAK